MAMLVSFITSLSSGTSTIASTQSLLLEAVEKLEPALASGDDKVSCLVSDC